MSLILKKSEPFYNMLGLRELVSGTFRDARDRSSKIIVDASSDWLYRDDLVIVDRHHAFIDELEKVFHYSSL